MAILICLGNYFSYKSTKNIGQLLAKTFKNGFFLWKSTFAAFLNNVWTKLGYHVFQHLDTLVCKRLSQTVILFWDQCDQIGQFIALSANFQSLWQQLFWPNCPHLYKQFLLRWQNLSFSSEIIFCNFYRHLVTFTGHSVWGEITFGHILERSQTNQRDGIYIK